MHTAITAPVCPKTERVSRAHDNFGRSAAAMMVSRNFRKLSVNAYVSHPRPHGTVLSMLGSTRSMLRASLIIRDRLQVFVA